MTDIVRIFQDYATNKGWVYDYGSQYAINLIEQGYTWTGLESTIYFLHEFRRGSRIDNNTMKYDGTFYLLVHSDMNQNFFSEVGTVAEGKYENNIEPLVTDVYNSFWNDFYCSQMEVLSTNFIDVTNFLDANTDGIKIDYSVQYINSYDGR